MGKRLYVGNLPYSVGESDLESKFAALGTVESANLIIDRNTGRSKGFALLKCQLNRNHKQQSRR